MPEVAYGRLDQWRDVRTVDLPQARELAARVERRAEAEDEAAARATYLDLLAIAPGERALDVGCGSGVVLREVAGRVAPDGLAVGLDASPALLAVARDLAQRAGFGDHVQLRSRAAV